MLRANNKNMNLSKILKRALIIIPIGILVNLTFMIFTREESTFDYLLNFSTLYFLLAVLLIVIPWFTNVGRLLIWTRFFGKKLTIIEVLKIVVISELGASISPTAIGGAPIKIGLLIEKRIKPGAAISIASIASLEDSVFFVTIMPIAIFISSIWKMPFINSFFQRLYDSVFILILISIILILAAFIFFKIISSRKFKAERSKIHSPFWQKIWIKLKSVWGEFKSAYIIIIKKGKLRFLLTTILTGIQWVCRYSVITALSASLGLSVKPILFFVLQWLVFTLAVFIPTPGAAGGAEASFYFIFQTVLPDETIGMITAGWRFLAFYGLLATGILLLIILYSIQKIRKRVYQQSRLIPAESL